MRAGDTVAEDETRNESARNTWSIFDGHVAPIDGRVPLAIALGISASSRAKDGDESLHGVSFVRNAIYFFFGWRLEDAQGGK